MAIDLRNKSDTEKIPAIVLGAHKIGLGIIRSLGQAGIPVVSVSYYPRDMGYVSKYVREKHFCPHPEKEEEQFVLKLLSPEVPEGLLIPSDDATLVAVCRNRKKLETRHMVMAPEEDITKICIDKKHTYELAEKIGVLSPKTLVTEDLEEAEDFSRRLGFPVLLKPSVSHRFFEVFHVKMIKVVDAERLRSIFSRLKGSGLEMMVQEFIPGDDTSGTNYNTYCVDGEPVYTFTARKWRLSPPGIGFPRVIVSEVNQDIHQPGNTILEALKFQGFSCIEFKKDMRNGNNVLMEINPRLNLSSQHAVKCGYNFPYLAYNHTLYGELIAFPRSFRTGVFWIDPGKDIGEWFKNIGRNKFSLWALIRPYLSRNVYTIPSLADPAPLLKRCKDFCIEGITRLGRKVRKDNAK